MPAGKRTPFGARQVYGVACIATLLVWIAVLYPLQQSQSMQQQAVERNLLSLSRAILAHSSRTIQWVDNAALLVRDRYVQLGERLDLAGLLEDRLLAEPLFVLLSVTDAKGALELSSQPYIRGLDLSDREHIKVHLTQPQDFLFPGRPVVGRVSGKPSIQFTRKVLDPRGALAGVVVVSVDPYYFTTIYQSLNLGDGSFVELFRDDGLALVQRADSTENIGVSIQNSALYKHVQARGDGVFKLIQPNGTERLWSSLALGDYGLHVAVGIDLNEQMAPFTRLRSHMLAMAVLLSLLIFALAGTIVRYVSMLERTRRQAVSANEQKSRFLSNVSHELRTPLNGILGYTELLTLNERDPERSSFLHNIHESGAHLLSLVDSLLALSRIEKGLTPLSLKAEPLRPMLNGIVQIHTRSAHAKGLTLSLDIDPELPEQLECDRVKLTQILHNLIRNAVKFTDKGAITVHAYGTLDALIIEVNDTGRGISPEDLDYLFERFFQASGDGTHTDEGLGLGLSIVKQLTELMHGKITVSSALHRGTTFRLELPWRGYVPPSPPSLLEGVQ